MQVDGDDNRRSSKPDLEAGGGMAPLQSLVWQLMAREQGSQDVQAQSWAVYSEEGSQIKCTRMHYP